MPSGASFNPDARATIGKSPQNLRSMQCTPFGHAVVPYRIRNVWPCYFSLTCINLNQRIDSVSEYDIMNILRKHVHIVLRKEHFVCMCSFARVVQPASSFAASQVWNDLHSLAALKSYRCILHYLAHALMVLDFTPVKTYKIWKDKMGKHFPGTPCIKRPWKAATIKGRNAPGLRQTSGLACWAWKMQRNADSLVGNQKLSYIVCLSKELATASSNPKDLVPSMQ